jgi:ABC transport system ATP-binding/permease protein
VDPSDTTGPATPAAQANAPHRPPRDDDPLDRRLYLLARAEPFRDVDRATLERLAELLQPREVAVGDVVCRVGDPADAFYVIESGSLAVLWESQQRSYTLRQLGPGDAFGEIALLRGGQRTASVRADAPSKLWELSTYAFALLRAQSPSLNAAIEQLARERVASAREYSFEDAPGNLAALEPEDGLLRIGRRADNDLVFSSRLVSNHHALLERKGNDFRLRDLHSSNGTFANGREIAGTVALHDGDEIWLGDERLIFDRTALQHCSESYGLRISANELVVAAPDGRRALDGVALSILPGELVAITSGDGADASTLLAALAGLRRLSAGRIDYNGMDISAALPRYRAALGYVPRSAMLHGDLSIRQALSYAARLRLPADTLIAERDAIIAATLDRVALAPLADARIDALTDEARKRAAIAVELLGGGRILFLEQPTAGLGPAGAKRLLLLLRQIAAAGSTVVFTSQAAANLDLCDKVVMLAAGGTLGFAGSPARARSYFAAANMDEILTLLDEAEPDLWDARFRGSPDYRALLAEQLPSQPSTVATQAAPIHALRSRDILHQVNTLAARNVARLATNRRAAIAVLALPIAAALLMLAIFPAQPFALNTTNPLNALAIVFLLVGSGIVYGIGSAIETLSDERAIVLRERAAGLSPASYILAKALVAAPLLLLAELLMLIVLLLGQRLPARGPELYAALLLVLWLNATAALALGLLVTALVSRRLWAARLAAAIVLLELLFAGAISSVPSMWSGGRWLSHAVSATWAFAAAGHVLDLHGLFLHGSSPIAPALLLDYRDTFAANIVRAIIVLAAFTVLMLICAIIALDRRSRQE